MKSIALHVLVVAGMLCAPVSAQTRLNSVSGPGPTFIAPYNNPAFTNYGTYYPGIRPGYNPYAPYTPYNPYGYNPYAPYGTVYPSYGVPIVQPNGLFQVGFGGFRLNMWRSPSGYYYPWAGLPSGCLYSSTTILYAPQQSSAPVAAQPPISTIVKDMLTYLDESKEKGRVSDSDYQHLKRRALDLEGKEDTLFNQAGGSIDPQDEQLIRNDLNSLGAEITQRCNRH